MIRGENCRVASLALLVIAAACPRTPPVEPQPVVDAEFVFTGTMVVPRASTLGAEDVTDLAIVRVERVLRAPTALANLSGSQVTIKLRDPSTARAGERRVYYTNGWQWGESVGVVEVVSRPAPPSDADLARIEQEVVRGEEQQTDRQLLERLRAAQLVVAGRVVAVRPSGIPPVPTEHDPQWREADIAVEATLKGSASGSVITIFFPGTDDPMWFRTPRFEPGMTGIWLLHRFEWDRTPLPRLVAPHPYDFRPRTDEDRIRRLLQQLR